MSLRVVDVLNHKQSLFFNIKTNEIIRKSTIKKAMGKVFFDSDLEKTTNLIPIQNGKRLDSNGEPRSHSSECEFALDDCTCWCQGKYHGVGRKI